ncbi:methionine--tRNA ligase [Wukongibacter baidiensis]|uniref:methionine--tRNA ligase n=1 Tax=Wukongibacter baidiensis TaxID=1723361 RepID=UPI003D7F28DE
MSIFIGGAWPYANGSLHVGHIAGLIAGDVLARYFRLKGEDVLYVSGSDCHGTPISIRAKQENVTPEDIATRYHDEFKYCFEKLGFSYDLYSRTDNQFHRQVVQQVFIELFNKGYIYKKSIEQVYCEECSQFLPDRYVEGDCPNCGEEARGDQCDHCGSILNPDELNNKKCKLCGSEPKQRETEHFYFTLSKFQSELENYLDSSENWRENAVKFTKRYLDEGLKDRAATRDLDLGIDVPLKGFEDKKIYVWIEAVCGYLSASKEWANDNNKDWEKFWKGKVTSYYVHGKDNIPFHTLIWPALLLGIEDLHLPDKIISSEYLTLEGKKFSTSRNWAVWVPYIIENYDSDSIRYFLTINGPEKRDADFSWREFINSHNGELLGAFGNFVNRTLVFINKSFGGKVPEGIMDEKIQEELNDLYDLVGEKIEHGELRSALESVFAFIRNANKYFDIQKPWIQVKEDTNGCNNTLYTCVQIIANLSNLLYPFVPFACEKIKGFLDIDEYCWNNVLVPKRANVNDVEVLFERIDKKRIEEEIEKLGR